MDMASEYTIYATRCADGAVDRHPLNKKTVWMSALADIERFDHSKECGPHTLLSAQIIRTPWTVAVEPAQSAMSADVVRAGALGYRCPKCQVAVGQPCENLTERRKGTVKPTSWPHSERIALWGGL